MTLQEITDLLEYNLWANNRLFEAAAQMPAEQYYRDLKSSHGGIHGTFVHIVGAQKVWLARWLGSPDTSMVRAEDVTSLIDLIALWEQISSETAKFLQQFTDEKLHDTMTITTSNGKRFTHTYQQMLQHLVNHSSIHRGQVSAMMRQLGIRPPATDLIGYYRQK